MRDLTLYRLEPPPGGGFHFGEEGLELEESNLSFPSDSLYAALIATVAEQEGAAQADEFVRMLHDPAAFRLSSVFPCVGNLPLLPLPRLRIEAPDVPRKFAKKVKFVSPAIFTQLCNGEDMGSYIKEGGNGRFLQGGAIWLTKAEQRHLPGQWAASAPDNLKRQIVWQKGSVPRVTIDRVSNASNIYQAGRVNFNSGCGLWLAVGYGAGGATSSDQKERLETLLHHLGDRGIGGERTNGYGAFQLDINPDFVVTWPQTGNGRVLLSRLWPKPDEVAFLQDDLAAYQLVTVGGWFYSPAHKPLRRKRVTLVAEGSVLPAPSLQGERANVTPQWDVPLPHPVYRCGYALSLPITLTVNE